MEINYIKGSSSDFFKFVDSINDEDKVAILSHNDLDGLSAGVFLEKILEAKNIPVEYIDFLDIKADMMKEVFGKLKDLEITKIFISDIGVDSIDFEGFSDLRKDFDVFLIDHHPMNQEIADWDNIIKTDSQDCAGMTCYFLGEGLIDAEEWNWLCCAAIFSDFSYKEKKNLEYLQESYPGITYDNISSSTPGINGRKINSALIYYAQDKKYVFKLVKERKLNEIDEAHEIVEEEIERLIDEFPSRGEHHDDKHIHLYEINSKFNVISTVCSLVSKMKVEDTFVFYSKKADGTVKFSARNQGGTKDVGELMRKCTAGLEGANGGGHKPAAAANVKLQDFDEFKKRLLE